MGEVSPHFFRWGDIICHVPHFFLFRFCIWRDFNNKSDVCHVLCEELFMLDGRLHIIKFMLKQSLVWYHRFCLFINFIFDKIIFSIFQVSSDHERWLTAFVRHFTLCGILLERLFPCNSNVCKATAVTHTKRIDRNLLRKETSFVCYTSFLVSVRVLQLHMWKTTVQPLFFACRNLTGFALTLVVTYSETDIV